ncbi:MAG: pseudouridine-5'-phosphate glycosidase [Armatimonadetes bacterium]|nr:pseudouridine-5'-phosphate glycosidase [Armatimonadota bacterium]
MRTPDLRTIHVAPEARAALEAGAPVVALESAVFSDGLPPAEGRRLALRLNDLLRSAGVTPALIAVRDGRIEVGVDPAGLAFLYGPDVIKVAERDLAVALAQGRSGGTTVSATMAVAHAAGLRTLATGGIGGVHLSAESSGDVSADLDALRRHPLVVVCAGAKAICDTGRTAEALDTLGVTVVGYQTGTYPAFYVRTSGVEVPHRVESPEDVVAIAQAKAALGDRSALLVVYPPPVAAALDAAEVEQAVASAMAQARGEGITGSRLTPYLLGAVARATGGRALAANLALLEANAALAAAIERAWAAARRVPSR